MKKGMQKKIIIFVIFLFATNFSFGQDKTNPIVFSEIFGGFSGGSSEGWTGGFTVNYQFKDNLITGRYTGLSHLRYEGSFFIFPVYTQIEQIDEYAIMYGRRHIYEDHSFSYSAGISTVDRNNLVENEGENDYYKNEFNLGLPFEVNIKWFNKEKERYRIYCLIPVGKPIAFSRSFGFKLIGNISKTTFIGLGISYGLGWHKTY